MSSVNLPLNCTTNYYKGFLSKKESKELYETLYEQYEIPSAKLKSADGKSYVSDFGKIMFMDQELYDTNKLPSSAWGKTAPWPNRLKLIKTKIEEIVKKQFAVCVCIYYPNGTSGVDFHSDYSAFGDTTVIASISVGEERVFQLREKSSLKVFDIILENGSLFIMGEHCQERYEHALPIDPKYKNGRINLTFRQYGFK